MTTITREEVLRLAGEAGAESANGSKMQDLYVFDICALDKFAASCIAEGERRERSRLWDLIDSQIRKDGDLSGNGCDELAQNNGLVLACNMIIGEMRARGDKDDKG